MEDPISGGARAEAAQLQARKRLVYLVALAGGVAIFLLSWSIRGPGDPFLAYLYPLFAALLAGLWLTLWRRPDWLARLEPWMLALVAAIVLSRLAWHFHAGGSLDDRLLVLAGGHYWAVGIVILAAFVMLDHRAGLRAGLAILIVASLIALAGVIGEALDGTLATETAVYLLRVHLFLGVLLVLASIATSMRDTVKDALVRSEAMARAARTDPLTGLANRRAAEAFLDRQAAAVARYGHPVAVIGMDIDHFKAVNDAHGHACGDAVIEGVARRLEANLREPDFVARWGGEEFLIVAPETSAHEAQQLAERCRAALASEPIAGVPVTGSFGITVFRAGDTLDDVLGRADNLMYAAKAAGRDRVLVE
ncbi:MULTISPECIES: diguanylate cyclase [unclassified Thioalkalivibrio]|uniref:GGDEF domain-containing protein n=1 Tax=unclassified Thioalkalivibrio TaxID=2621013 RepID=UPI00037005EB|nr:MULTISPECIES: GGDEF domain-containing protein [unclassified Thioalkalivibrio]